MGKFLVLFISVVFFFSCASTQKNVEKAAHKTGDYYYKIGLSYLDSGNNSQAIYYLTKAYELNPNNPDVLNALGIAYSSVREFKKAEKFFLRAIELAPEKGELYTNLGVILAEEKKFNKAIWYLKKAVENPEYKNKEKAYYNLALIYKKMGDEKKYEENLKKALSYNQYFINAYLSLGNFYLNNKRYQEALNVYMKAYDVGIFTPEVYLGLGKSYYYIGKLPKAKYYFLKAKKFAKDNIFVLNESEKYIEKINRKLAQEKEKQIKEKQAEIEKLEKVKQLEEISDESTIEEGMVSLEPVKKNQIEKKAVVKSPKKEEKKEKPVYKTRFFIQLGAYSKKEYATDLIRKLKEKGFKPELVEKNMDGKMFYFVIIGYFKSYLEASNFYREKIKPEGFPGIVKFERTKG